MANLRSTSLAALGAGIALTSSAAAPAVAQPGFTAPQRLSRTASFIDLDGAAVAPTGRTAVLWRSAQMPRGRRSPFTAHYEVALGPDPAHLGPPTVLHATDKFIRDGYEEQLVALADGTMAACFQTDPRHGDAVAACSFAPPEAGFGPLHEFARFSWKRRLRFVVAARPGGLALVTATMNTAGDRILASQLMDTTGAVTSPVPLGTSTSTFELHVAAADDGTVAAVWPDGAVVDDERVALLRPGAQRFEVAQTISGSFEVAGYSLTGGRALTLGAYRSNGDAPGGWEYHALGSDGSLTPATLALPRPTTRGRLSGEPQALPDGTRFAAVQAYEDDGSDCDMTPFSAIGAGPLTPSGTPATAQLLSTPGQIAEFPAFGQLDDGTIIVTWGDSLQAAAQQRLEAAVQAPGGARFAAPQVLPHLSQYYELAVGGNEALLVWSVGDGFSKPAHLETSAFTRTGPLARQMTRPRHPLSNCD